MTPPTNAGYREVADEAAGASKTRCRWASTHGGTTCIEATPKSAFWCLNCKRAFEAAKVNIRRRKYEAAMLVECPHCERPPGQTCHQAETHRDMDQPHKRRIRAGMLFLSKTASA